jgi:hypothetical protein
MAEPFEFSGCNQIFRGDGDTVQDLHVFANRNRRVVVSAWRLSDRELDEIIRTGVVMVAIVGRFVPPFLVGSNQEVRRFAADYGDVWPVVEIPTVAEQTGRTPANPKDQAS